MLIRPFISSCLSLQFPSTKVFIPLFSGTERPAKLKHGTHMDNGLIDHVFRNRAAGAYSSLSFQFSDIKMFVTLFIGTMRPTKLKVGKHKNNGWMHRLYRNQAGAPYTSLYYSPAFKKWGYTGFALSFRDIVTVILSFRDLPNEKVRHNFLRNCEVYIVET